MATSLPLAPAPHPEHKRSGKTFFGHPRGLATLFMTEMWERFSFYGMRALLPLYLISGGADAAKGMQGGGLGMTLASEAAVFALYSGLVYLLTLPGGWFGDRVWGPRKTVTIAAVAIMAGHLLLAVPGAPTFFAGLALVAVGSGLLKANISTMVGHLYDGPDDPRRDGGFTVFYMGINLGGLLAPLAIGTIGETVSWHLGFALAAVGMGLGLIQFLLGTRHLSAASNVVPKPLTPAERRSVTVKSLLAVCGAAALYLMVGTVGTITEKWLTVPLAVLGILVPVLLFVRIKRDRALSTLEQSRMSGYIWFFVAATVFWAIYDQGSYTMATFAGDSAQNTVLGWEFPVSWYQSVNPVLIMALAPLVASAWLWLNRRGREPSTIVKFVSGLVLAGISFFLFLIPMTTAAGGHKAAAMWLVAIYFVQTVGELCLSPVGLSLTTKMSPAKYASQMMGAFFLAATAGDSIMSLLSTYGVDLDSRGVVGAEAAVALAAGIGIYVCRGRVQRLMGGIG
ncbi:peptide MFS transporter [Streptomyces sp. NPDC050418]|uniref:peptide MFS transporter n=1 Tax=Streptomyces sp. NPDC050418 TaxID=3365612 RepID=UPI0037889F12